MPFLDRARAVDNLHSGGMEYWPGVRQSKRTELVETAHQVVRDRLQRERRVDPQSWAELIGLDDIVRVCIDPGAEFGNASRFHREAGGLFVSAKLEEQVRTMLEGGEQVEIRDAAAGAVRDITIDRQHD